MTLPTFKPDAVCAQCGHDDVTVTYLAMTEYACMSTYAPPAYDGARHVCHYHSGAHFHRACRRCGWCWAEAVLAPSLNPCRSSSPEEAASDLPEGTPE